MRAFNRLLAIGTDVGHDTSLAVRQERVEAAAIAARDAALRLQTVPDAQRRQAMEGFADAIRGAEQRIDEANRQDLAHARAEGLDAPLLDRLVFDAEVRTTLLQGLAHLAQVADPLIVVRRSTLLDDGLELHQVTVPLGVLGVVFESRPDALVQIAALAVRSGNAVLLKGGREARETNRVLAALLRRALAAIGLPEDAVVLLEDREDVAALLALDRLVDLVVPRGSKAFVRHVMDNTHIPVLGHADGVCHVYVHERADLDVALQIVADAKTDHPAACNAVETVLVDQAVAAAFLPRLRMWADQSEVRLIEDDTGFGTEFGDLRLAVGVVNDQAAAMRHIARHGSRHTEAIVTEDEQAARAFVGRVDAASVLVNASTRFADGYRYGLGAEVGVSTSKLHARGPVGLEGLTSTKWVLVGQGQQAAHYQGPRGRRFLHRPLQGDAAASFRLVGRRGDD